MEKDIDCKKIQEAIKIFLENSDADERSIVTRIEDRGISHEIANYLVLFTPLAFSRIVCEHLDVHFENEYVEHFRNGKSREGSLIYNQMFAQIYECSEATIKAGMGGDSIVQIAGRSHEFKLVNNALIQGIELASLKFSTIHFLVDIDI